MAKIARNLANLVTLSVVQGRLIEKVSLPNRNPISRSGTA
jgi:hypothetical protein